MRDFNLHHEAWDRLGVSKTLIEKSEGLLIVTQRWEIEQMVPVDIIIYKESITESAIDLVFATLLLTKSLIIYSIMGDFDYNLNH